MILVCSWEEVSSGSSYSIILATLSKLSFSVQSRRLFPKQSLITILFEQQFVKNEVQEE